MDLETITRIKIKVDTIHNKLTCISHILSTLDDTLFEVEQVVDTIVDENPTTFEIGDILEITNNYKNKDGTQGQYVERKGLFLFILDEDGTKHKRVKKNLRFVRRPDDNADDDNSTSGEDDGGGYGYIYDR